MENHDNQIDPVRMAAKIGLLRQTAEVLQIMARNLPAVEKNTNRILASIKMLELNISDLEGLSPDRYQKWSHQ